MVDLRFWRNTRTEKHRPDDPLDTNNPPTPSPTPTLPRDTTCGACGCRLARSGEILATGENYKKFLKHEQIVEGKDREIAKLQADLAEMTRERDALKGSGGSSASGHRPGGRIQ